MKKKSFELPSDGAASLIHMTEDYPNKLSTQFKKT